MTLSMPARSFSFGPFTFLADQQRLQRNDVPVRLGSRALAILETLLEHAGELVSKQDLMSRVWPDTFVDESNLKVNVAALRKALDIDKGESSHIVNVSGRGYRFATAVSIRDSENSLEHRRRNSNLPASTKGIVGRHEIIKQVIEQLSFCPLVTIVGSGGVGKTAVATAVAETQLQIYRDGVCFVDFASLDDPASVPHAILVALRLSTSIENANDQLNAYLQDREILLVFDTCEHMLSSAAECAELIQSSCPMVRILATSREPLGAKGERLYRLPPLSVPPADTGLTADQIRAFPAIELFLKLASETLADLRVDDSQASTIAELCRELDGVPLAIELAAVRVRLLGFEGLPSVANDQFLQFRQGQRTSPRRHESLAAAYEWSFNLLPEKERSALVRLSTLNTPFDLGTAASVASGGAMSHAETIDCIARLVSKSLIERLAYGGSYFRIPALVRYYASKQSPSRGNCGESETSQEKFHNVNLCLVNASLAEPRFQKRP